MHSLTEDGEHILGMSGVPLFPRFISERVDQPGTMVSLVERDGNQALGRRGVLVSRVPVGNGGIGNASHALLGG